MSQKPEIPKLLIFCEGDMDIVCFLPKNSRKKKKLVSCETDCLILRELLLCISFLWFPVVWQGFQSPVAQLKERKHIPFLPLQIQFLKRGFFLGVKERDYDLTWAQPSQSVEFQHYKHHSQGRKESNEQSHLEKQVNNKQLDIWSLLYDGNISVYSDGQKNAYGCW